MKGRILLIDDPPDAMEAIGSVLTKAGFQVRLAAAGGEALRQCQDDPFDVVVTDVRPPHTDGMELIGRLKALDPTQEIIILTGPSFHDGAIRALRDGGAFDCLTKPLEDVEHLVITVANAVEKRRLQLTNLDLIAKLKAREQELSRQNEALQQAQSDCRKWSRGYHQLFEQAPIGHVSLDHQGFIVAVNRSGRSLLGMAEEETRREPVRFWDHFEEVDAQQVERLCTRMREETDHRHAQLRVVGRSGKTLMMHLGRLEPSDEDNGPCHLQAALLDISGEERNERTLRESERRYRSLMATMPQRAEGISTEGILEVNREGVIEAGDPRLCAILGYSEEELIGKNVCEMIERTDWPQGLSCLDDLGPGMTFTGSCCARRKNGEPCYAEFYAQVLEDRRIQGIVHDVTDRILAEQKLRASERRFKETLELLPIAICETDAELTITYANQLGMKTFGYGPEEIAAGINALSLVHPEDREQAKTSLQRIGQGGKLPPGELRLIHHDGTCLHMLANSAPIVEDGRLQGFRISLTDVTEFRQLLKQLQEGKRFEAIATLAGGIAHQFNNALSVIKGGANLLMMQRGRDPRDVELLEHIDQSSDRLAALTSQLLAYARGGKYRAEVIEINEMLRRCLRLIGHAIDPGIQLDVDLTANRHRIEADLTQMQAVLSAILQNASEALAEEGAAKGYIRVSVAGQPHLPSKPDSGEAKPCRYVHIRIEDNGQGMAAEQRERIFDPFFTTKFQGRGLGMAAAYGIVKNHRGWIQVDSKPGLGTTVHLYLPIVEDAVPDSRPARDQKSAPRRTILMVEDEPILLRVGRDMLEALGYRVLDALSGKAAIRVTETYEGPIELVLLDLILPDIPAKAVQQHILQTRPETKIVICSGYSLDGPAQGLLAAGAIEFLQKPFSLDDLQNLLAQALPEDEAEQP